MDSSCSNSTLSAHDMHPQDSWPDAGPSTAPSEATDSSVDVSVISATTAYPRTDHLSSAQANPWDLFEQMDEKLMISAAKDWMNARLDNKQVSKNYVHVIQAVSSAPRPTDSLGAAEQTAVPPKAQVLQWDHRQAGSGAWSAPCGYPYSVFYYAIHPGYGCIPQLVGSIDDLQMPVVTDASTSVCGACFNLAHHCMCLL